MPAAVRPPAPSLSLLRYLRAQSRGRSFCDTYHGLACHHQRPGSGSRILAKRPYSCGAGRQPRQFAGGLCTSDSRGHIVMQAAMFDFESIFPRSPHKSRSPVDITEASRLPNAQNYAPCDPLPSVLCRPTLRERFWNHANGRWLSALRPEDLPSRDENRMPRSMFSPSRTQAAKAALEPRLRCTEVDENGEVILADGEFKKTELIAKYGLLPRDLRKIDASNLPHILVRPSAILINLLHLRVLIKSNRVLLFDVYGSKTSYPQSAFMYDLQGKLKQNQSPNTGGLPYEFRALEAVLTSVTTELEAEFEMVQAPVIRILSELEDDIDRDKLRILLVLSKKVSTFEQKAKLVRDAIEELLEADDDLADMYLTEKMHDLYRGEEDHTEIEMLLESYHKICDEVAQEASNLVSSIRNTEEIIRAILDSNRNSLMLLGLKFEIGALGLAMGTFVAGLYGMNLNNFIEEKSWGFGAVTSVSTVMALLLCWYGVSKVRRAQQVKMGSSLKRRDRNNWYPDESTGGLLDARNREKLRQVNMMKAAANLNNNKRRWWRMPE